MQWKNSRIIYICISAALFIIGCRKARGLPDRYVKRDVLPSELVGNWEITEDSINRLIKENYTKYIKKENHRLTLFDDETCNICTFLYIIPDPNNKEEEEHYIHQTKATWKITKTRTYVRHVETMVPSLEIEVVKEIKDSKNIRTVRFFIAYENKRFILWEYIGDPDYTEYMDFIKVSDPNKI